MLTEIYCDKFKTGGKDGITRDPITFSAGLNIVEGDDNGSNSIGKSTFLMAIDFCFGVNDYVNVLKDLDKIIGRKFILLGSLRTQDGLLPLILELL